MSWRISGLLLLFLPACAAQMIQPVLPGTRPLELPADWRGRQHQQISEYYERRIREAPPASDVRALLGLLRNPLRQASARVIEETAGVRVEELSITMDEGFSARALLYLRAGRTPKAAAIVTSHSAVGDLLDRGTTVAVVPSIERTTDYELGRRLRGKDRRHLLHRLAFIAGRTLTGMEVDQLLAVRDYLAARTGHPVSLYAEGEGAIAARHAIAVDSGFASAALVDDPRQKEPVWRQPVDRMLYGSPRLDPRVSLARYEPAPAAPGVRDYDDAAARNRHFEEWLDYLRRLDVRTDQTRRAYWKLESTPSAQRAEKASRMRRELQELLGIPAGPTTPLNPRTRLLKITDKYVAYEVMLQVLDGVEAFGHLLVPRIAGARLPAVICQHGLGGQPKDITSLGEKPDPVYHEFGARLAETGYVVFAPYVSVPIPQAELINPIVRKAAAVGAMRTGMEAAKLRRIVDFLVSRPFVNPQRIGYYGLSYGGYSAIWMCPVEPRIRAVVISGHFNDWRAKITNEELGTSYLFHPDEDFYNWNVLNRFTHVELIAAMYPRPVMVEFADRDATTTPEWHERAWREVERVARAWGAENRIARDVFHGVHEIGGAGTFAFLDRWLRPERASGREYKYLLWPSKRNLPGLADSAEDTLPYSVYKLDAGERNALRGTFRVSTLRPVFSGMELKLSRAGNPAPLMVRFGTRPGAADIGEAQIAQGAVHPLYDLWYEARVSAKRLDPSRLYHVELRVEHGTYEVYGPRRLGGTSLDHEFPFAYRVLDGSTRRGEDTHEFVRTLLNPVKPSRAPAAEGGVHPAIRITTSILPGGQRYTETSRTLIYTDGLLARMARDGFNGIWVWLNTEEAAMDSAIFPELDDAEAAIRLSRLDDLAKRARRFGIDVYVYLATGYHHHVPAAFYEKYPEVRGVGWGTPMCTSDERVRRYHAEIVTNLFRRAPDVRGLVVIYDSEGFFYCGNTEVNRGKCPRCRNRSTTDLALEVLTNLNDAMHRAGGDGGKRLIAWNYGTDYAWIQKLIPRLPKDILFQVDFSKGGELERDGIHHSTGDYNLTLVGPPGHFARQHADARAAGLGFVAKTEHAVSQEFIFVPYIPAMEQWYRRFSKMRDYEAAGWFANWCHYGYAASLPARLFNRMSKEKVPGPDQTMLALAADHYGERAAPIVVKAWKAFSDGIRAFPYSDRVSRLPGPLQKGPSHPFILDPGVQSFGQWRSWQNDLEWTRPWGPAVTSKYLSQVKRHFTRGIAGLEAGDLRNAEWRIARTIESSLETVLNLIDWIETRDRYPGLKQAAAQRLEEIALAERRNVLRILPVLEADSRLGYASEGGGVLRGGLFTPELVRWKIGQLDDLLVRELPRLTSRAPAPVPLQFTTGGN